MDKKYRELSVIGQVWTIGELFNAGIKNKKKSYILATFRKLEEFKEDEEFINSKAVYINSLNNIIKNATAIKEKNIDGINCSDKFHDDGSIISAIWYNRLVLDDIKSRVKENYVTEEDVLALDVAFREIKKIFTKEIMNKALTHRERDDIYDIKEEIEDAKYKVDVRVKRSQIDLV